MDYYIKIENKLTDYLLDTLGPNVNTDKEREEKFLHIKKVIEKAFENDNTILPHIYCFGSFPLKTYLTDSDLDITIIFEDRETKNIICNNSYDFLNR
jgi:DNA polymerase sigma